MDSNIETNGQSHESNGAAVLDATATASVQEVIEENVAAAMEDDSQEGAAETDWEAASAAHLKSACKRLRKLEASMLRSRLLTGKDLQQYLNVSISNGTSRKVAAQVMYGSISKATGRETSESFVSLLLSCWAIVETFATADYLEALESGKNAISAWDGLKRISGCVKRDDTKEGDVWDVSAAVAGIENGASKVEALVQEYLAGGVSAAQLELRYKELVKPAKTDGGKEEPKQTNAGRNPAPAGTQTPPALTIAPAPAGTASTVPDTKEEVNAPAQGSAVKPLISTDPVRSNPNTDGEAIVELMGKTTSPADVAERIGGLMARTAQVLGWKLLAGWIDSAETDALVKLADAVRDEIKERGTILARKAIETARRKAAKDANDEYEAEEGETARAEKIVA